MSAGSEIWPENMFEPLTIGIVFPFLSVSPWQVQGIPKMLHLGQTMSRLFKDTNVATGNISRELFQQMWNLRSMPEDVVRRMLYFKEVLFHVKQKEDFEFKKSRMRIRRDYNERGAISIEHLMCIFVIDMASIYWSLLNVTCVSFENYKDKSHGAHQSKNNYCLDVFIRFLQTLFGVGLH
jgi:hypothetical protein